LSEELCFVLEEDRPEDGQERDVLTANDDLDRRVYVSHFDEVDPRELRLENTKGPVDPEERCLPQRNRRKRKPIAVEIHAAIAVDVQPLLPEATPREAKRTAIDLGVDFLKKQRLPLTHSVSAVAEGIASDVLDLVFA
jgi:hypothetical protein